MAKIYTKSGDKGQTSLVDGLRVDKSSIRVDLYGDIDELNSFVGYARSFLNDDINEDYFKYLEKLQSQLFNLGSHFACSFEKIKEYKLPEIREKEVFELEQFIDIMEKELSPLRNFILPTGSSFSSSLHICRAVTRRLERRIIAFYREFPDEEVKEIIAFTNRLSDYFFILARYVNKRSNIKEYEWDKNS